MTSVALLAALVGCTPGTVDTVQPGALDKDALSGEWFWRRTVSDVPYGTAATFSGASDPLERIRWRIEEEVLLGYRAYENVEEAAASGLEDEGFFGAPLLAFPIEKHFDIRRGYDPTTGEESNVVLENTEAPWHDREYIRVDWSANVAQAGWDMAGLSASVLDWTTSDERDGTAPQFDDSNGDGVIDHLLLTQHLLLEPDTVIYPGYGDIPVCMFFGQAEFECAASEVEVTSSFLRVGDRAAVQGLAYDDRHMSTFGYFQTERLTYDRAYGLVQPNRIRYNNLHPLWEQTFATDTRGRPLCEVEGETTLCEALSVDDDAVPVVLPYADRVPRPIVYHAGPNLPEDLKPVMAQIAADWSEPLAETVDELRYWECVDGGGKLKDCADQRDDELAMFVFCPNNPSLPEDGPLCNTDHTGPQGRPDGIPDDVRIGDLRYHLAEVFESPQNASPFGYGPSAADPVGSRFPLSDGALSLGAGEIVSGSAFVYGHVLDLVSNQVADLVQLMNGEIETDAFVNGENVDAWVQAVRDGTTASLIGTTDGVPEKWTEDAVSQRLSQISNGFAPSIRGPLESVPRPTTPAAFEQFMAQAGDVMDQTGVFGAGQAEVELDFEQLLASDLTDLTWTTETIGSFGFDPATAGVTELSGHSPLELIDPVNLAAREAGLVLAGQHAVDLDDGAFTDASLLGLAHYYRDLGWTREAIVADVRAGVFREVMLHELGHTLGLRHNFAGSFDALNYRPEYWALRDDGDVGPRHVDAETTAEIDGRIRESQYSTVMDYPGSRNVGWAGLGHYDHAAVKFGYGQLVEVFTAVPPDPAVAGLPNDVALSYIAAYNLSNVYPQVLLFYTNGEMLDLHYTQYPAIAGDLEAREDVPLSRLASTLVEGGAFGDGFIVTEGAGRVDAGMPAVPYRFCSDEFAVGMTCARFDEGADPYEVNTFLRERYWNDYVLTNFSRARYGFGDSASYVGRLQSRTFEPIRTWQRYYALLHGVLDVDNDPNAAAFFAADRGFGGWSAATDEGFRFLVQVISRPEPGFHATTERADGVSLLTPSFAGSVDVPLVTGAYYESEWDFESGYHWFENQDRIGSYWDRMLALIALTNTASYGFVGYDTSIDPRAYAIGYQDLYRDPIALLLGQLMADEVEHLGPALHDDGTMSYRDPLDPSAVWPPAGADLVQPAAYWLVQFDAGLFGKALLSHGYDRTFLDRSRLYLEGSGEAVVPGPDQLTVSFTDPASGKTWTAWSYPLIDDAGERVRDGQGEIVELGSSAHMVRKANDLLARCETDEAACARLQQFTADLDLQRHLYETFEKTVD